jgi:tRNA wybutosine-synthesizing protein 3
MSTIGFESLKAGILHDLASGIDLSPKGSIDSPIVDLVNCINWHKDYCTSSSCSGRISCYRSFSDETKGVNWILVTHGEIDERRIVESFQSSPLSHDADTLTVLKCEGALLHVICRDLDSARILHGIAMSSGFRESGLSISPKKIMLAIRTTAYCLEFPIARGNEFIIDQRALRIGVDEANKKIRSNFARLDRLLNRMKDSFGWPLLKELKDSEANEVRSVRRWGHCAVAAADGKMAVLGGFGLLKDASGPVSRNLPSELVRVGDGPLGASAGPGAPSSQDLADEGLKGIGVMHAAAAACDDLLIVFGGRTSPREACDRVVFINAKTLRPTDRDVVEANDGSERPAARWGHAFVHLGQGCCLLFGGRNDTRIFDDAFILRRLDPTVWRWMRVSFSHDLCASVCGRVFHASCELDVDIKGHSHRQFQSVGVAIASSAGDSSGAGSRDEESRRSDDDSCAALRRVLCHGGLSTIDDIGGSADGGYYVVSVSCDRASGAFTMECKTVEASPSDLQLNRFGHTLTNIGAKTILMIGGTSFSESSGPIVQFPADFTEFKEDNRSALETKRLFSHAESDIIAFDWYSRDDGAVCLSRRPAQVIAAESIASGSERCWLGASCRVHHQAAIVKFDLGSPSALVVSGGGMLCVGFSPHFCEPLRFILSSAYSREETVSLEPLKASADVSAGCGDYVQNSLSISTSASQAYLWVLLVPKVLVKKVKILLEENEWIDKKHRISQYMQRSTDEFQFDGIRAVCSAFDEERACTKVSINNIDRNDILPNDDLVTFLATAMAVPLNESAYDRLLSGDIYNDINESLESGYKHLFGSSSLFPSGQFILLARAPSPSAKIEIVSTVKKAREYLMHICSRYNLSTSDIPKKFEMVGDILMIPEDALLPDRGWTADKVPQLWSELAACFQLSRVARKAKVDPGPVRESHVVMLHPQKPAPDASPLAPDLRRASLSRRPGWVTVPENGIDFSFDVTRVM